MNQVTEMLDNSIDNIRRLIDVDTIIGKELLINGVTIIPISNVKLSFATLGVDVITKKDNHPASGGVGGCVDVKPTCFLVINDKEVKMVSSRLELTEMLNNLANNIISKKN